MIPFNNLKLQYETIKESISQNIQNVLNHGSFIMGPEVRELEQALSKYTGSKNCITCSSGTDALLMSLMSLNVGPGDGILTTPFTFIATAEVIRLTGAKPIFVDIDPRTFNLDPHSLRQVIDLNDSHKLRGIITVNLFGLPCDYDKILPLAKEKDLFVLEDAAQSLGANFNGQKSGTFGNISATSFFPAKPLGCYGDGGAIFTDNDQLADKVRSIRIHGKGQNKYDNVRIGLNGRLDTLQAAILLAKLDLFEDENKKRNDIAQKYSQALKSFVAVPELPQNYRSAWAQYSILTPYRDELVKYLKESEIPTAIYYPKPLHLQEAFKDLGYHEGDFPVSEKLSKQILSLPFSAYLTEEEQNLIITKVSDYFRLHRC